MAQKKQEISCVQSSKPRHVKWRNQKLILSILRDEEVLSISDIALRTNLSKTTVKKILESLLEEGLVQSVGKGSSTEEGGKKPELYAFNKVRRHIFVLYLETLTLLNLCSETVDSINMGETYMSCPYNQAIATIVESIRTILDRNDIKPEELAGIVIGMAGIIDSRNGIICNAVHRPSWPHNLNIRKDLADSLQFDVPIHLDNGIAFMGYAELQEQENDNFDTLVTLYSDHHTGGCVFKKREPIHGENGFMGEFGHMIADPHSKRKCICGASGCFEVMVSPARLLEEARKHYREYPESPLFKAAELDALEYADIFSASNQRDEFACRLMDEIVYWYAILIRNVILSHDPQIIILRGIYQSAGDYFINSLRKEVKSSTIFETRKDIRIVYSNTGNIEAVLDGAVNFVWNKYLNDTFLAFMD